MTKQDNGNNDNIFKLIGNLSSQSTESSNIVLRAISQGLASGISQGIASGNISFSSQDVIALANVFKPKDDIVLRLIDGVITPKTLKVASNLNRDKKNNITEAFANPHSHDSSHDSSGLPSSVYVFDVTAEKLSLLKHTESLEVSKNADDENTEPSVVWIESKGKEEEEEEEEKAMYGNAGSPNGSRKCDVTECNEVSSHTQGLTKNCHPRIEKSIFSKGSIESLCDLSDYISPQLSRLPVAVATAHKRRCPKTMVSHSINVATVKFQISLPQVYEYY
jgi:hypothetical protein